MKRFIAAVIIVSKKYMNGKFTNHRFDVRTIIAFTRNLKIHQTQFNKKKPSVLSLTCRG